VWGPDHDGGGHGDSWPSWEVYPPLIHREYRLNIDIQDIYIYISIYLVKKNFVHGSH
jgi:hypothetical protein